MDRIVACLTFAVGLFYVEQFALFYIFEAKDFDRQQVISETRLSTLYSQTIDYDSQLSDFGYTLAFRCWQHHIANEHIYRTK